MEPVDLRIRFREAQRAQLSLLARVEKRLLAWIAERMPQQVNSDHLTFLGFAAMFWRDAVIGLRALIRTLCCW